MATNRVDLVLLEIRSPAMDGLHLIGGLLDVNRRVPVVIYSGDDSYQDHFLAWAADAYLVKNSDLSELTDTVRDLLARPRTVCPVEPSPDAAVTG